MEIAKITNLEIDGNEIKFEITSNAPGNEKTEYKTNTNGEGLWVLERNGWRQQQGTGDFKLIGTRGTIRRNISKQFCVAE